MGYIAYGLWEAWKLDCAEIQPLMRHSQIIIESSNLKQPPERCVRSSRLFLNVAFCHSGILANTTDSIVGFRA